MTSEIILSSVIAGLISFLVALGTTEYRLRRERSVKSQDEIYSWYAEAAQLSGDIQQLWKTEYEKKKENGNMVQYDELKRRMKMRSRQINSHIGESESLDVDQEAIQELEELSSVCSSLDDILVPHGQKTDFREHGEEIVAQAASVKELALDSIKD